jgi:hypothetical protein
MSPAWAPPTLPEGGGFKALLIEEGWWGLTASRLHFVNFLTCLLAGRRFALRPHTNNGLWAMAMF